MKKILVYAIGLCLAVSASLPGAQTFPSKPIRVINVFPAGSVLDVPLRAITQRVQEELGQPVIIDNRPGAESIIGLDAFSKAAPDGYTICLTDSNGILFNPAIRSKLPYDPNGFVPLMHLGSLATIMIVNPAVSANSVPELLALARSQPGKVSWGTFGLSSPSHILLVWLQKERGIEFLEVPYKSATQSMQGALTGEVQVATVGAGVALPLIKSGKLRVLGVNGSSRSALLPDVPSYLELGIDVVPRTWFGIFAPGATARPIVQSLNTVMAKALAEQPFADKFFRSVGLELATPAGGSADQFAAFIKAERSVLEKIVALTGVKEQ